MEPFNLADILAGAGVNIDTGKREQIEYISIDRIAPDPDNFYELSGIDDLAENISLLGLQQPLLVRPMPGDESQVVIISGHRRYTALKMLIEQDGRDDLRDVPCIVDQSEENPKLTQLKLIYANASTRVMSSAEQAKQAELVEKLLYELKEDGMEFPGRMRDHVAKACQSSTGKLARLKVIRDGLTKDWASAWESGDLADSTAYELARMAPEDQRIIFTARGDNIKNFYTATAANIAKNMQEASVTIPRKCCPINGGKCGELNNRKAAAAKLNSWCSLNCNRGTCCLDCSSLTSCTHYCESAKAKRKELRSAAKTAEEDAARRFAESQKPAINAIADSWKRVAKTALEKQISGNLLYKTIRGWSSCSDDADLGACAAGMKTFDRHDSMPGGISFDNAKRLIDAANLLGCSIDYLLGREDCTTVSDGQGAVQEKCVNIDTGWRTGAPDEPGLYAILAGFDDEPDAPYTLQKAEWTGTGWESYGSQLADIGVSVAFWIPLPEE